MSNIPYTTFIDLGESLSWVPRAKNYPWSVGICWERVVSVLGSHQPGKILSLLFLTLRAPAHFFTKEVELCLNVNTVEKGLSA